MNLFKIWKSKNQRSSRKKPFIPHAKNPISVAVDVCFLSSLPIKDWIKIVTKNKIKVEIGLVQREGATGKLNTMYLREPNMNIIRNFKQNIIILIKLIFIKYTTYVI